MNQALLERCRSLYNRARLGDPTAHAQIAKMKASGKSGDLNAAICFNTMAVLHWQAQQGPGRPKWPRAEAFYKRLAANDMAAWDAMTRIQRRAKARDEQAMRVFAMLKAIHNQYKASVWYPGAPRLSGYGLPMTNVAGITIPRQPLTRDDVLGPTGILAFINQVIANARALPGAEPPVTPQIPPISPPLEAPPEAPPVGPSMLDLEMAARQADVAPPPGGASAVTDVAPAFMPPPGGVAVPMPRPVAKPGTKAIQYVRSATKAQKTPCELLDYALKNSPKHPSIPVLRKKCEEYKKTNKPAGPDYSRIMAARSRRSGL